MSIGENKMFKSNDEIEEKDLDNKCSSSSDESQDVAFFDCLHEKEG
jgi:hypothetical protein